MHLSNPIIPSWCITLVQTSLLEIQESVILLAVSTFHLDVQEPSHSQHAPETDFYSLHSPQNLLVHSIPQLGSWQYQPGLGPGWASELLSCEIEDIQSIVQVPTVLLHDPENECLLLKFMSSPHTPYPIPPHFHLLETPWQHPYASVSLTSLSHLWENPVAFYHQKEIHVFKSALQANGV